MSKVFVVILNWNGLKDTKELLADLAKVNTADIELTILVVDNGSKDIEEVRKLAASAKASSSQVQVLENKKNLGFAEGNNVGIRYAMEHGADYVIILNNDTLVHKDFLRELIKVGSEPGVGAVSPKIYFAKGFEFHKDRYSAGELGKVLWYAGGKIDWDNVYGLARGVDEVDIGQYNAKRTSDFATGCCMLLTREAIQKVGMFDAKYFLYYEDTDLSERIKRKGMKIMYAPESMVWHKVSQSSAIGGDLNDYFITRNRMLFGFKYARARTKFALFRESLQFTLLGRKWQTIGARDFYLFKFGKGSWR